jgi:pSer/pThr/pTyr-binding forkhead associated (FHA) protein
MDSGMIISAILTIITSGITAYITTRINMSAEKKKWQREFTLKYAEAQANNPKYAKGIATQFAIGVLVIEGESLSERERVFLPPWCRLVVGRGEQSEITVNDVLLSNRHAAFYANDRLVFVEDLGSTNAVFVNEKRVETSIALSSDDVIQLGKTRIIYKSIKQQEKD